VLVFVSLFFCAPGAGGVPGPGFGGIGGIGGEYGAPKGGIGICNCCSVIGGMPCIVMGVVYGSVISIGGITIGGMDMGMFWYWY